MFKFLCLLALVAVTLAQHHGPPNPEKMKADMAAAGVSAAGISTITSFMSSHKPGPNSDRAANKAAFDAMLAGLTAADRAAFEKLKPKKPSGAGAQ